MPPQQTVPSSVTSEEWTAPEQTWTLPDDDDDDLPPLKEQCPLEQLIEMGFANR